MELRSFMFEFQLNNELIHAIAIPFQSEDFIFYDISIPGKVFSIKPHETGSERLRWTDLRGNESLLFTCAGKAIEEHNLKAR